MNLFDLEEFTDEQYFSGELEGKFKGFKIEVVNHLEKGTFSVGYKYPKNSTSHPQNRKDYLEFIIKNKVVAL